MHRVHLCREFTLQRFDARPLGQGRDFFSSSLDVCRGGRRQDAVGRGWDAASVTAGAAGSSSVVALLPGARIRDTKDRHAAKASAVQTELIYAQINNAQLFMTSCLVLGCGSPKCHRPRGALRISNIQFEAEEAGG